MAEYEYQALLHFGDEVFKTRPRSSLEVLRRDVAQGIERLQEDDSTRPDPVVTYERRLVPEWEPVTEQSPVDV